MKGPRLGPSGGDITWLDQVALEGGRRLVPETSNLKPQTSAAPVPTRSPGTTAALLWWRSSRTPRGCRIHRP